MWTRPIQGEEDSTSLLDEPFDDQASTFLVIPQTSSTHEQIHGVWNLQQQYPQQEPNHVKVSLGIMKVLEA